jgi:glycerol-3-phosphate dehydrogenase
VAALKKPGVNQLALIYQWIKKEKIDFKVFQELIKWVHEEQQHQIDLDTWD